MTASKATDDTPIRVGSRDLTEFGLTAAPPAICEIGIVLVATFVLDRAWRMAVMIELRTDGRFVVWWRCARCEALVEGGPRRPTIDAACMAAIHELIVREIRKAFAAGHDPTLFATTGDSEPASPPSSSERT